jgi:hypothetical protein
MDVVEQVVASLEAEFSGQVDRDTLRVVAEARARRFADAPICEFVPTLVARDVRRGLLRRA